MDVVLDLYGVVEDVVNLVGDGFNSVVDVVAVGVIFLYD